MSTIAAVAIGFGVALVILSVLLVRHVWRHREEKPLSDRTTNIGLVYGVGVIYCGLTLLGLLILTIINALT
jgi:hypothetical protein